MTEKGKSEISPQKRSFKLAPLLGDWTTYRPAQTPAKKVKIGLYGFDRLSEEELKQAHLLHYNFALKICDSLKTKLRAGCDLYSVDALQNTYASFLRIIAMPVFQGKFTSSNYHDEIFISFDLNLIDALINAALGAQGTSRLNRGLAESEEIILDAMLPEHLMGFFEIFKPALQDQKFEKVGSPDIAPDGRINPQSTFVYFAIELSVNNALGKIVIGYDGGFLKNLLKKLNLSSKRAPLSYGKLNPSIFNLIEIPVTADIGKTTLTMSDIRNLEIGDVVSFDQNINNAIQITLANGHKILGQPGKKDGKLVVGVVGVEKEKVIKIAPPSFKETEEHKPEDMNKELSSEEFDKIELPEVEFSEEDLEGSLKDEFEEESLEEEEQQEQ